MRRCLQTISSLIVRRCWYDKMGLLSIDFPCNGCLPFLCGFKLQPFINRKSLLLLMSCLLIWMTNISLLWGNYFYPTWRRMMFLRSKVCPVISLSLFKYTCKTFWLVLMYQDPQERYRFMHSILKMFTIWRLKVNQICRSILVN